MDLQVQNRSMDHDHRMGRCSLEMGRYHLMGPNHQEMEPGHPVEETKTMDHGRQMGRDPPEIRDLRRRSRLLMLLAMKPESYISIMYDL
jgi:hypothetical protein